MSSNDDKSNSSEDKWTFLIPILAFVFICLVLLVIKRNFKGFHKIAFY